MKRTLILPDNDIFPRELSSFISGADIYDSSCSAEARVYFLDKKGGYYLKSAPIGTLEREAKMTDYFHKKGLGAEILSYISDKFTGKDWLLSARVRGEDCVHEDYLSDPHRLSVLTAELLRSLHEHSFDGCPVPDHTARYLETAENNYRKGIFDTHFRVTPCFTATIVCRILCSTGGISADLSTLATAVLEIGTLIFFGECGHLFIILRPTLIVKLFLMPTAEMR